MAPRLRGPQRLTSHTRPYQITPSYKVRLVPPGHCDPQRRLVVPMNSATPELVFDAACSDHGVLFGILRAGNAARQTLARHGITAYKFTVRISELRYMIHIDVITAQGSRRFPHPSDAARGGIPVLRGPRGGYDTARGLLINTLLTYGDFDDNVGGARARAKLEAELAAMTATLLSDLTTSAAR